eukprot:365998-Chlamydomonas_euryale.AAC.17
MRDGAERHGPALGDERWHRTAWVVAGWYGGRRGSRWWMSCFDPVELSVSCFDLVGQGNLEWAGRLAQGSAGWSCLEWVAFDRLKDCGDVCARGCGDGCGVDSGDGCSIDVVWMGVVRVWGGMVVVWMGMDFVWVVGMDFV